MGYPTDQPPINYLKRRIIYYKKKLGSVKNYINDPYFISKYGKEDLNIKIEQIIKHYTMRIRQFKKAVNKLEK